MRNIPFRKDEKMKKRSNNLKVITMKTLGDLLCKHFLKLIIAAVAVTSILFVVVQLTFVPKYESVATLYIMKEEDHSTTADRINEYNMAIHIVKECGHLLSGHKVLDSVIENLENDAENPIDISYGSLRRSISVVNPADTRILELKVISDTPENAKQIVDVLCSVGIKELNEVMGDGQIKLYEYGVLNTNPCNKMGVLSYLIVAFVSAFAVFAFYLVKYLVDNRVDSDEEIEEYFALSILGHIPDANSHGNGTYDKRYRYSKYGIYAQMSNANKEGENRK